MAGCSKGTARPGDSARSCVTAVAVFAYNGYAAPVSLRRRQRLEQGIPARSWSLPITVIAELCRPAVLLGAPKSTGNEFTVPPR
jgi:hypothetical protein